MHERPKLRSLIAEEDAAPAQCQRTVVPAHANVVDLHVYFLSATQLGLDVLAELGDAYRHLLAVLFKLNPFQHDVWVHWFSEVEDVEVAVALLVLVCELAGANLAPQVFPAVVVGHRKNLLCDFRFEPLPKTH